jgi:hypothetical protein
MVFSSQLFLYAFVPVFFSLYFLIPDRYKNWLILTARALSTLSESEWIPRGIDL